MGEPAIRRGAVPVLDVRGDIYHVARREQARGLAFFLIVAAPGHAHKDLSAALLGMVDVPVVAAARLKRHVGNVHLAGGQRREVALPNEILRISVVGLADGEDHFFGVRRFGVLRGFFSVHTSLAMRKAAHALGQPA